MTASSSTSDGRALPASLRLPALLHRTAQRAAAPGRAAGLGTLALSLALLLAAGDGPLGGLRLIGFDLVQRVWPRVPDGPVAVIVAIDDESLRRFGQWPWPRDLFAVVVVSLHSPTPLQT